MTVELILKPSVLEIRSCLSRRFEFSSPRSMAAWAWNKKSIVWLRPGLICLPKRIGIDEGSGVAGSP